MKSNAKSKILILIALGILFALLPIITANLSFIAGNNKKSSEYSDNSNLDNKNLKISTISEKIHIDNNWTAVKAAGICTGEGTYSEPYIIEDLVIDGAGSGSCILIENSDIYFKIENCTLYNSGSGWDYAGIRFQYVSNSQLINNNCSSNFIGIKLCNSTINVISGNIANDNSNGICLWDSDNNTVSGNIANDNSDGIFLLESNNNIISGNTANKNKNYGSGIELFVSDYNTVSGNTANNNYYGIFLDRSNYNTISGNIFLGNDVCITDSAGIGNVFENNDCGIIPGYNLFFLIGTLSVAAILISKKIKKS
jgi:parallel beta-helix repeat protein